MSPRSLAYGLALFVLACAMAGCAAQTSYDVTVNTLAAQDYGPEQLKGTYFLFPEDERIARDDLLFVEVTGRLKPLLADKGMPVTTDVRQADYVAFVSYGAGETRPVPRAYPAPSLGFGFGSGPGWGSFAGLGFSQPIYSVDEESSLHTQYVKITVFAVDKSKKELGRQVWSAEVKSRGDSDDFRTALPAMLKPASDYVGKDSGGHRKFVVTLREGQELKVTEEK